MIGHVPPRPTGNDRATIFMQWVYDCLTSLLRQTPVSGQQCSTTTKGFFSVGGGKGTSQQSDGTGMHFRGEYDSNLTYLAGDVVVIRSGTNKGSYVCVAARPGSSNQPTEPDTGNSYWLSLGIGNSVGDWV